MSVPSLAELRLGWGATTPQWSPKTQKELAEMAQIDESYVSHLETGRRMPSRYLQARLAAIYGIPLAQVRESVLETLRRAKSGEPQRPEF